MSFNSTLYCGTQVSNHISLLSSLTIQRTSCARWFMVVWTNKNERDLVNRLNPANLVFPLHTISFYGCTTIILHIYMHDGTYCRPHTPLQPDASVHTPHNETTSSTTTQPKIDRMALGEFQNTTYIHSTYTIIIKQTNKQKAGQAMFCYVLFWCPVIR